MLNSVALQLFITMIDALLMLSFIGLIASLFYAYCNRTNEVEPSDVDEDYFLDENGNFAVPFTDSEGNNFLMYPRRTHDEEFLNDFDPNTIDWSDDEIK